MENNGDFVKVDKLQKPEDWNTWKFDIRILLQAADLMDIVTGKIKAPVQVDGQSNADHETALTVFNKNDFKAQKVIVTALGKQPKMHVMNCSTSKQMWDKLSKVQKHLCI